MRQGGYCIPWLHISIWVWSIGTVCFPQGLTTASYLTDGISSTLSFFINRQSQELRWGNKYYTMTVIDENTLLSIGVKDPLPIGEKVCITLKNGRTIQGKLLPCEYSSNSNPQTKTHLLCYIVLGDVKVSVYDVKELKVVEK